MTAPHAELSRDSEEGEVFPAGVGAQGVGIAWLLAAAFAVVVTAMAVVGAARDGRALDALLMLFVLLPLVAIGVVLGLHYLVAERNRRVVLSGRGVRVINARGHETVVPWGQIIGVRWAHTCGKHQRGSVHLELLGAPGRAERLEIAGYWGPLPREIIELRGAIIRRLGLVQAEATEPGWWAKREEVVWRRPDAGEARP